MTPVPIRSESPFSQAGRALLAAGYHPVPVMPGDKAPGTFDKGRWQAMVGWPKYRDEAPAPFIVTIWGKWEDANIGVVLGTRIGSDLELIALDFDTDDTYLLEMIESAVPSANVRKRGRRGYTGFYLAPAGTKGRRFRRGKQVIFEILTGNATRQTIVPPSIHPDTGRPYEWLTRSTLANTPPLQLVVLTEDMIEKLVDTLESLEGVEEARAPARTIAAHGDTPHRALNNAALANLSAWVPALPLHKLRGNGNGYRAVAHWRAGAAADDWNANVGIHPGGITDFGADEGHTPLNLIMLAANWPLDHAFEWLAGRLGWSGEGFGEDLLETDPLPDPLPAHDPETGEVLDEPVELPISHDELPAHLTQVPGLLGDVIDWIAATDRRPNRVLALGAAITVLGTLVGRKVAGPTLSGTHLYVISLAPSGSGKDHALRQIDTLMKAAGSSDLIGPDDFMSMSAVVNVLQRSPCCVCPMDEFGAYVARISHKRASSHERGMTKVLRSVWGASFKAYRTPEYAGRGSEEVEAPAMSIYGTSTPGEFFAALQSDDVVNGFVNRLLMLQTSTRQEQRAPASDPFHVPDDLSRALADLRLRALQVQAPAKGSVSLGPHMSTRPNIVVPWGKDAEAEYKLLGMEVEKICEDEALEPFFARTAEMAIRLATIRAVGCGRHVWAEDVAWGREIAVWSARRMAEAAGEHMAANEFADYGNRIVRFMRRKGGVVSRRDIQTHIKGALRVKELTDLMEVLVEAGRVVELPKEKPVMGRPPTSNSYRLPG